MATVPRKLHDNVSREKRPSPFGSTVFVGLRLLEPLLQHGILSRNLGSSLITRLGGQTLPLGTPVDNVIGLSPHRLILLLMSAGCSFKQIFWLLSIGEQEMPVKNALPIGIANIVVNSVNSLLFISHYTTASSSGAQDLFEPGFPSTPLVIGAVSYVLGTAIEIISEMQRKRFKADPRNKGKNYSGGLFSLARHINYGGHILMRAGYALASGGWIWSAVVTTLFARDFVTRAIPVLDHYCQERYKESWAEYKRRVHYKLFPGIY